MRRKLLKATIIVAALAVAIVVCCEMVINNAARGRTYDDINAVPHRTTALLLGTSPVNRWGGPNLYYYTRIEAAAQLFHAGKVDSIIVSGAHDGSYNEPELMLSDLAKAGVPQSHCIADDEGYTTQHSILRARTVFHKDSVLVISQQFHNERAIFMASGNNLDAIAYNAGNYYGNWWRQLRQKSRERISRVKAVLMSLLP